MNSLLHFFGWCVLIVAGLSHLVPTETAVESIARYRGVETSTPPLLDLRQLKNTLSHAILQRYAVSQQPHLQASVEHCVSMHLLTQDNAALRQKATQHQIFNACTPR